MDDPSTYYTPIRLSRPWSPGAGSSFTPTDLPNLFAWYKFNTGITIATGVSQWDDQSGNARHLTQGTGANQPANSSGTITFTPASSHILNATWGASAQPKTICMRFNPLTYGGGMYDGGASDAMFCNMTGGTPTYEIYASGGGALTNSNLTIASYNSMVNIFNGASSSCRVGSNTKTTGVNPGTSVSTGFNLGGGEGATTFSNIAVREIIIYSDAKSDSDVDTIITYLNAI